MIVGIDGIVSIDYRYECEWSQISMHWSQISIVLIIDINRMISVELWERSEFTTVKGDKSSGPTNCCCPKEIIRLFYPFFKRFKTSLILFPLSFILIWFFFNFYVVSIERKDDIYEIFASHFGHERNGGRNSAT